MLTIYLHESQRALLSSLKSVFPDIVPTKRSIYPNHREYHASLRAGLASLEQTHWLRDHFVLYFDRDRLLEHRTRTFLRHTTLDPQVPRTVSLSFSRAEEQPGIRCVRLRSREQEATLYLLPGWTGQARLPFEGAVGTVLVSREGEQLTATRFHERGCLSRQLARCSTEAEMTAWLLEHRYLQIYSFAYHPDICGLYCLIHDRGLAEILRVNE